LAQESSNSWIHRSKNGKFTTEKQQHSNIRSKKSGGCAPSRRRRSEAFQPPVAIRARTSTWKEFPARTHIVTSPQAHNSPHWVVSTRKKNFAYSHRQISTSLCQTIFFSKLLSPDHQRVWLFPRTQLTSSGFHEKDRFSRSNFSWYQFSWLRPPLDF
jgi:hypothetical protein